MRLTTSPPFCAECNGNLAALTPWNPLGHTGPVTGLLYLYFLYLPYITYIFVVVINLGFELDDLGIAVWFLANLKNFSFHFYHGCGRCLPEMKEARGIKLTPSAPSSAEVKYACE